MTKFRPCIDLHSGQVKQIVGGTLSSNSSELKTNHVSKLPASHFANLYKEHALTGGHVIMLGPGNQEAASEALGKWTGGLQVGGGVNEENAMQWIHRGADKVGQILKYMVKQHSRLVVGYYYLLPLSQWLFFVGPS